MSDKKISKVDSEVTSNNITNEEESSKFAQVVRKIFSALGRYFAGLGKDIARAVQENVNIIWAILLCVPGIFIGLFLTSHIKASYALTESYNYSGISLFIMVMAGCFGIVCAFGVKGKRNLRSSIYAAITTAIIAASGIYWISCLFTCSNVWVDDNIYQGDAITSIVCIVISFVCPLIGAIGSFFTRNKNYKKDTL